VIRTLINPMCGVVGLDKKQFRFWNIVGGVIWTELVLTLGFVLGDVLKGSVDKYLLPVIALIIFVSFIPVAIELFKEWQSKRYKD
jgi:membrane-associated protein